MRSSEVVGQQRKIAEADTQGAQPEPLKIDRSRIELSQRLSGRRRQTVNQPRRLIRQLRSAQKQRNQRFAQARVGMTGQMRDQGCGFDSVVGRSRFGNRKVTHTTRAECPDQGRVWLGGDRWFGRCESHYGNLWTEPLHTDSDDSISLIRPA